MQEVLLDYKFLCNCIFGTKRFQKNLRSGFCNLTLKNPKNNTAVIKQKHWIKILYYISSTEIAKPLLKSGSSIWVNCLYWLHLRSQERTQLIMKRCVVCFLKLLHIVDILVRDELPNALFWLVLSNSELWANGLVISVGRIA